MTVEKTLFMPPIMKCIVSMLSGADTSVLHANPLQLFINVISLSPGFSQSLLYDCSGLKNLRHDNPENARQL